MGFVLAHFPFSDTGEMHLAVVLFPTHLERKKWVVATSLSLKAAPQKRGGPGLIGGSRGGPLHHCLCLKHVRLVF